MNCCCFTGDPLDAPVKDPRLHSTHSLSAFRHLPGVLIFWRIVCVVVAAQASPSLGTGTGIRRTAGGQPSVSKWLKLHHQPDFQCFILLYSNSLRLLIQYSLSLPFRLWIRYGARPCPTTMPTNTWPNQTVATSFISYIHMRGSSAYIRTRARYDTPISRRLPL